MNKRKT